MKNVRSILILFLLLMHASQLFAITRNNWYEKSRYGLFVHYVPGLSIYPAGGSTSDINVVANKFDAKQLAEDAHAFGMEYVILTAFHAKMRPIYPSAVTEKCRPGNSSTRDCIRDLINELKPKGIKLMLYVHSTDGFEFPAAELANTGWGDTTNHYLKWNNYVSELMAEAGARYGTDLDGFWLDMTMSADYKNMIDKPRIRQALLTGNPNRVLVGNGSNLADGMDYSSREYYPSGAVSTWKGGSNQIAVLAGSKADRYKWWACTKQGTPGNRLTPEELYRFTVLQSAVNYDGGMAWAASPYLGGGWEDGVKQMFAGCGNYMKEVEGSIKGTLPSTSFPTLSSKSLATITNGIVATKSPDDQLEYIHVLSPPVGKTLKLAVPADGKFFSDAVYLNTSDPIQISQNDQGVTLQLSAMQQWDTVNSVICLVASNYTAPTNFVMVNNTDTLIKYSGTKWMTSFNRGFGDYKDDVAATTLDGDFFSLTFDGDGIEYLAPKGGSYGAVEIFIDGVSMGTSSQYASSYTPQQVIYSNKGLAYGTHTIKGVKKGSSYCQVDALRIYRNTGSTLKKETAKHTLFYNHLTNLLKFNTESHEQASAIFIYNMLGHLIMKTPLPFEASQIDLKSLSAGMYLASVHYKDASIEVCRFRKDR